MAKKQPKKISGYDYKYMFLSTENPKLNRKISVRELNLINYVIDFYQKKFDLELNEEFLKQHPNAVVYLFNASFNTNKELLDKVTELYGALHPKFKDKYDYIGMIAEGHNAEQYGFLKWSDSKKEIEYTEERLVPIIYYNDYSRIVSEVSVTDLLKPDDLVYKILKDISSSINVENEEYVKQLMKIIYVILEPKYDSKIPYLTDEEMYYVDREYDKSRVSNLLDSIPIRDKYEAKETLYYNLLSVIMVVERTKRAANNFNYSYEPYNGRVNNKKLSNKALAYLSILSEKEYTDMIKSQNNEKIKRFEEDQALEELFQGETKESYDEIARRVIEEYNRANDSYITLSDIERNPSFYQDIVDEINDEIEGRDKGNSRN